MIEENNRKGPGIFYAVVGVATLVVAIIGATFAYFSATAQTGQNEITGKTADLSGEALSVTATKYSFPAATVSNKDLVPAAMSGTTVNDVQGALNANCENRGYTGCHVWDITVGTESDLTAATITLTGSISSSTKAKDDWSYIVYTSASDSAATATKVISNGTFVDDLTDGIDLNLLDNDGTVVPGKESFLATGEYHYYLMVYLANVDQSQNADDNNNAEGTYTGTVTLDAAGGGNVVATFTAAS